MARAEQHCNRTPVPRQHVGASATSRGCSQCALAGPARDDPRPWGCLGAQNIVAGKEVTASHLRPEDPMRRGPVRGSSWGCCPGLTRTSARFRGSRGGRRFTETRAQARGRHPLALQNSAHTPALGQAPPGSPPPPSPLSRPPYGTRSKSVSFLTLGGGLAPAVGGELRERGPRQVRPPRRPRDLARCPAHWPARRAAFGRWMRDARVQVAAAGFSARM